MVEPLGVSVAGRTQSARAPGCCDSGY